METGSGGQPWRDEAERTLGQLGQDEDASAWWVWIVGAVVAGGIVLRTGRTYRREHRG